MTQAELKAQLYYHPESGDFVWLVGKRVGRQAGGLRAEYFYLTLDFVQHLSHRLAWFYMTGDWPEQVDHRDLVKINNVWENLREATFAQNKQNCPAPCTNTSGIKGVRFYPRYNRWHAQLRANGKRYHLGYFDDKNAAIEAWRGAAAELHGAFAR